MNGTIRLARAELRKLFTTKAFPVSFAIAIVLAIGSVLIDAMVAGRNGAARLGTDANVYQMLKFGAIIASVAWTLFIEQVILRAAAPGIKKWLPTNAAIGLTNAPGPGSLSPAVAGVVLTGYAIGLLALASRTTIRRDIA